MARPYPVVSGTLSASGDTPVIAAPGTGKRIAVVGFSIQNQTPLQLVGQVTSIGVTAGGTLYTSAPTVTFTGGGGSGATAVATISGGSVTAVTVTNPGYGYTSAPTVGFTGGGGSGAAATAAVLLNSSGSIISINVVSGGTGYPAGPVAATITGGGGSGATAVAYTSGGVITAIVITNPGSGYTSQPTVTVATGTGLTTTAVINGSPTVQLKNGANFEWQVVSVSQADPFTMFFGEQCAWRLDDNAPLNINLSNAANQCSYSVQYRIEATW